MRRPVTSGRPPGSGGRALSDMPEGAHQSKTAPLSSRPDTRPSLSDPHTYYVGRCVANYKDGRKCANKVVNGTDKCLGHSRVTDAT